jgi:GTPase SAR1 family protein/predicted transcriptional regulator
VAEVCDRVVGDRPDGAGRDLVDRVRKGLDEPLRIAVAGRVSAGKSTLVNALLRQRIAPTDVSECTRYVTVYRHGLPERLEVVRRDGTRRSVPLTADGALPEGPIEPGEDVERLEVHLAHDALSDLVLIDTPGLGSLSQDLSAATAEVLGLDRDSRQAVAGADALVFVLTATLRADEALVVRSFRDALEGTTASSLSALCVLNKADLLAEDEGDPMANAQELAEQFAHSLRDVVSVVHPLMSLLAESMDTGRFTESHAATLRTIAAMPEPARRSLLLSADRFVRAEAPVPPEDRAALLELLGLHGTEVALSLAASGHGSAAELVASLRDTSGVQRLRSLLFDSFGRNADALKANGALAALERLSYAMTSPALAGARALLHDEIDALRTDPAMHRLHELRVLQEYRTGGAELPADLEGDLLRFAEGSTARTRLGLPDSASSDELQRAAAAAASAWKRFRNDGRASTTQQWIADVMARSCELAWVDASREGSR